MERLAMAPCGIDCNECNLYRVDVDPSAGEALVSWFRDRGWIGREEARTRCARRLRSVRAAWATARFSGAATAPSARVQSISVDLRTAASATIFIVKS